MINYYFIGNGFDLASKLQTGFGDYIKEQEQLYNNIITKILEVFRKGFDMKSFIDYSRYNSLTTSAQPFIAFLNSFKELLDNSDITIWDIIFIYFMKFKEEIAPILRVEQEINNYELINWEDVEKIIEHIVTGLEDRDKIIIKKKSIVSAYSTYPISEHLEFQEYSDNKRDLLIHILYTYCEHRIGESNDMVLKSKLADFLLIELNKFEDKFNKIIVAYMKKLNENIAYKNNYLTNFMNIRNEDDDRLGDNYIINFNYTTFCANQNNVFSIDKIRYLEFNVHGVYDKNIIIGIDQKEIESEKKQFIFTKTSRKLYSENLLNKLDFCNKSYIGSLIFFGHSLAKADYSYFQTFFDIYDLYSGEIKLVFIYTIYDNSKKKNIEEKYVNAITNLIMNYGKTMDNKDHGKNLLHKLILEGRLIIKKIDYDKFINVLE